MRVEVTDNLASRTADAIADAVQAVLATRDRCSLALSGGKGPAPAFRLLAQKPIAWSRVDLFQVDERVARRGSADRNLTLISHEFLSYVAEPPAVHEMPVDGAPDPDGYARSLPDVIDVVHLGLGPDGHTASLVPNDPVLEVFDRKVAMSGPYQDYERMTVTYPALNAAARIIFMIDGDAKRDALEKLIAGDREIPAARIENDDILVLTDVSVA